LYIITFRYGVTFVEVETLTEHGFAKPHLRTINNDDI